LSLLGYDPDSDYAALTAEARGRRVFPADPEFSLVLRKPSGDVPHGGGRKLPKDHFGYKLLKEWIAAGCPRTPADAPKLVGIAVSPTERVLTFWAEQRLTVTARYSDGSTADVTHLAAFQSNDAVVAAVDADGK